MFSEPKLGIPGTPVAELAEGSDSVETKLSEQLPEAKPAEVEQAVSVAAGSPMQPDGRQPKRARDIAELSNISGSRKKRKGNKKSG